jgi:anti-sigma factor RsiW
MNCSNVLENLSAFLDGELDAAQTAAIKAHMIRCETCRCERDGIEKISASIRKLPPLTAPDDFEYRIYASIHTRLTKIRPSPFVRWKTLLISSTALLAGLIIGSYKFTASIPVATMNPAIEENGFPAAAIVKSDDGLKEYAFDPFVHQNSPDSDFSSPTPHAAQSNPKHYVLDPVPALASYERTTY